MPPALPPMTLRPLAAPFKPLLQPIRSMLVNRDLQTRWLTALAVSDKRAVGRECDYARAEGESDTFDPIGLLAYLAELSPVEYGTGQRGWYGFPGDDGEHLSRQTAAWLAQRVGFPAERLADLADLSDSGVSGAYLADWVRGVSRG